MSPVEIQTPHGPARVHLHTPEGLSAAHEARAVLVMGHGAGGGVDAPDIVAARDAALGAGVAVALVEQPYRVAGRRAPAPARQLDAAWAAVVEHLRRRERELAGVPLIVGGRSLGARVACRAADDMDAAGVVCLAFPLQPPQRKGKEPSPSRLEELEAVSAPVLVVQGRSDPFGRPPDGPGRTVVLVEGNHGLKADLDGVGGAVGNWLRRLL